jgi:hypothetical protein
MAKEGLLDFYGTEFGKTHFRVQSSIRMHVHKGSKIDMLIASSLDMTHEHCMFYSKRLGWLGLRIPPFRRTYVDKSSYPDKTDAWECAFDREDIVGARSFVLGILHCYPCPEPEQYLVYLCKGIKILHVSKPKLW